MQRLRDSRLGRLDDAVVPTLQQGARATMGIFGAPLRAAHRLEKRLLGGRLYDFAWRRRRVLRSGVVVLAVIGSTVHFQRYPEIVEAREAARAAARQQTIRQPDLSVPTGLVPGAVAHGPPLEIRPGRYVEERQAVLAGLDDGEYVAVVSFDSYRSAADARAALGDEVTVLRAQYRIPDVNARPLDTEVVGGDLEASIDRVIDDEIDLIRQEEQALQELLDSDSMGDPAFEADARSRVEELRAVRNIMRASGAIVFALVVRAEVEDLRAATTATGVRLVDPVPDDVDVDASVFFGLRPEDRTRVTFGVTP